MHRALMYSGHLLPRHMAFPNPTVEAKTHQWRPGVHAPIRKVPSVICAFSSQKQPFWGQNSPKTHLKWLNGGKRLLHSTCGLISSCQRALLLPSNSTICMRNGQKMAKNAVERAQFVPTRPKIKNGPYLPCWASASRGPGCSPAPPNNHRYKGQGISLGNSEGWKPQKVGGCRWSRCPWNSDLSAIAPVGSWGEKDRFFQGCPQTIWGAQTSVFRPI